jgi:parvulin-like peptidyl-prolyl isomerase
LKLKNKYAFEKAVVLILMLSFIPVFTLSGSGNKENTDSPSMETESAESPADDVVEENQEPVTYNPEMAVAVVNGETITLAQLSEKMGVLREQQAREGKLLDAKTLLEMRKEILETLIEERLILQKSLEISLSVEKDYLEQKLRESIDKFGTEQAFLESLKRQKIDIEKYRENLRESLIVKQYLNMALKKEMTFSDLQLNEYYENNSNLFIIPETVRVSHILVKFDPDSGDKAAESEAKSKIQQAAGLLQMGMDFKEVATAFSEGPSAGQGGDLGYLPRGVTVPEFEEVAFTQEVGEIGDIIQTRFGYHIVYVIDKKESSIAPYSSVKTKIAELLAQQIFLRDMRVFIDGLKAEAVIQRFL